GEGGGPGGRAACRWNSGSSLRHGPHRDGHRFTTTGTPRPCRRLTGAPPVKQGSVTSGNGEVTGASVSRTVSGLSDGGGDTGTGAGHGANQSGSLVTAGDEHAPSTSTRPSATPTRRTRQGAPDSRRSEPTTPSRP